MICRHARPLTLVVAALSLSIDATSHGQTLRDRVWLAGKYDRNRVVVYLDAIQFHGHLPRGARNIAEPLADVLIPPIAVPAKSLAAVQEEQDRERFGIGDRYDLVLDGDHIATVTLTTLVVADGDEEVGNVSYMGALATIPAGDLSYFTRSYYALRRHGAVHAMPASRSGARPVRVGLNAEPSASTEAQIAALVQARLSHPAPSEESLDVGRFAPVIKRLQRFTISDGSTRAFAIADQESPGMCVSLAAWFVLEPQLKTLNAASSSGECLHVDPVSILDIVAIGNGRTGLVIDNPGYDGRGIDLIEYRDDDSPFHMHALWSISVAE